jgi:cellulose synthase/poly-beta-1,6-N-acetylglucosamine synthase-like glycosyltransferase
MQSDLYVSVIIPVRDEINHIHELINCLEKQTYPVNNFEIIFVDDNSTDGTFSKLINISLESRLNLRINRLPETLDEQLSHKKAAITYGIEKASGEIILMTDGDVKMDKDWIKGFVALFSQSDVKFISGPVMMNGTGIVNEVQSIEFASLIGTGAVFIYLKRPVMCNGANLAFRKEVFSEVDGFAGNEHVISGDDEFLMYKIFKRYPDKIYFLKSIQSTVWVRPLSDFRDFFYQRLRWSGKWSKLSNSNTIILAFYIFFVHVSFLLLVVSGLLKFTRTDIVILIWGVKILIEYVFFKYLLHFFKKRLKLFPFILSSLLYSFYAVTFGILSNFGGFVWKGRQYKN